MYTPISGTVHKHNGSHPRDSREKDNGIRGWDSEIQLSEDSVPLPRLRVSKKKSSLSQFQIRTRQKITSSLSLLLVHPLLRGQRTSSKQDLADLQYGASEISTSSCILLETFLERYCH